MQPGQQGEIFRDATDALSSAGVARSGQLWAGSGRAQHLAGLAGLAGLQPPKAACAAGDFQPLEGKPPKSHGISVNNLSLPAGHSECEQAWGAGCVTRHLLSP